MNDEGVTSLAVVDNGYNVVGNISNVDVKVGLPQYYYRRNHSEQSAHRLLAPHEIILGTALGKHLHTLHYRHPLYPWHE